MLLALALFGALPRQTLAGILYFTIENDSEQINLKHVYLPPAGTERWSDDLQGGNALSLGEVAAHFAYPYPGANICVWDVRVDGDNNQSYYDRAENLCANSTLYFNEQGSGDFVSGGAAGGAPTQATSSLLQLLLTTPMQAAELPPGYTALRPFQLPAITGAGTSALGVVRVTVNGPHTAGTVEYIAYYVYASPADAAAAFAQAKAAANGPAVTASGTPDGFNVPAFTVSLPTEDPSTPGVRDGESDCIAVTGSVVVDAVSLLPGDGTSGDEAAACALAQSGIAHVLGRG